MASMSRWRRRGLCCALLAIVALMQVVEPRAVTISGGSCAATCTPGQESPLEYRPGYTYEYELEGSTVLSVPVSADEQRITLKGKVKLVAISKCEGAIVLEAFQPIESDGEKYPLVDLDKYPLKFSWNGGKVDRVCPDAEDSDSAVNIKRAALSALQNSLESFSNGIKTLKEVDVSGDCKTVYVVSAPWAGGKTVKKSKDLLKCKDRSGYKSALQFEAGLHDLSEINNLPVIRSEHRCEQEISTDSVISKVTCTETHTHNPFGGPVQAEAVKVKLSLTLKGKSRSSVKLAGSGKLLESCLRFDHSKKPYSKKNVAAEAAALLTHICASTDDDLIEADVPDESYELLGLLRKMSKEELFSLWDKIKAGQICAATKRISNFFDKLLPQAGGAGAIGVLVRIIKNEETSKVYRQYVLGSLAFDRHPTAESIRAATPLLEGESWRIPENRKGALLGISALAHSFCRANPQCAQDAAISGLIARLASLLGNGCSPGGEEEEETIIATLKAFGNLGQADEASEKKILQCANDKKVNPAIRTAAIDAFRRMPCRRLAKTELLQLLGDAVDDSDIRIKAYITVMGCACNHVMRTVQEILDRQEESKQVVSYVESHVRNLKRTTNPAKNALKQLVADLKLKDTYKLPNYLKYSRNEETSIFSKSSGLGASGEANLIFSQRSYVPRAASLNLTLELFGNTMSLLEVGGRVENLEKRLEDIFSPNGQVPSAVKKVKEAVSDNLERLQNRVDKALRRTKRSPALDRDIQSNLVNEGNGPKQIYDEEPSADIYIRIFGNELLWVPLNKKKIQDAVTELGNVAEGDWSAVDSLSSVNVLSASMSVPTILGMPIKIHQNATLSFGLKYQESDATFNFPDLSVKVKVAPSAALNVAGSFIINAYAVKKGVRIVSSAKAANSGDFSFESSKEGFKVKISPPKHDLDLLKFSTNSFFLTKTKEAGTRLSALTVDDKNKEERTAEKCVPGFLGKICGVEFCFSEKTQVPTRAPTSLPVTPLKMLYPSEFGVKIKRTDLAVQGYELVGKWKIQGPNPELSLFFDITGSTVDRKIGLGVSKTATPDSSKYEILFRSPWKKLSASVDYVDNPNLHRVGAKVKFDEEEYALSFSTDVVTSGDKRIYTPSIEHIRPKGADLKLLEGRIEVVKDKQLDFELKTPGLGCVQGISFEGSISCEGDRSVQVKKLLLDLKEYKVSTFGSVKLGKPDYSFDLTTEFGKKTALESVKVSGNVVDNSRGGSADLKGSLSAESSLLPQWGKASIQVEGKKEPGHILLGLELTHGVNPRRKFVIRDELRYSGLASLSSLAIDGSLKMSDSPESDNGFQLLHTVSLKSTKQFNHLWNLDYTLDGVKESVHSLIDFVDNSSFDKADQALKASLAYPGRTIEYTGSFVETETGIYAGNTQLRLNPGDTYTLKTNIVDQEKDNVAQEARSITQKFETVLTSTSLANPVEVKISRVFEAGHTVLDAEVQAGGQQQLHSELEWKLDDGNRGTTTTEKFELSGLLFLRTLVDAKWSVQNADPRTDLDFSVEFAKLLEGRRVVAKAVVTKDTATKTSVVGELSWDAKRNPQKKLTVKSEIIRPTGLWAIETKSQAKFIDDQYALKLKGSLAKKIDNGRSGIEAELTLPSKKTLSLDHHFDVATESSTYRNEIVLNFKTLDDDSYKVKLNTDVRDKNYRDVTGKLQMDIAVDTPFWGGNTAITADSGKDGSSRDVAVGVKITPNTKGQPLEGKVKVGVELGKRLALGAKLAHGTDVYLDTESNANFDFSGTVKQAELVLSVKAPALDLSDVAIEAKTTSYWNSVNDAKTSNQLVVVHEGSRFVIVDELQSADKKITGTFTAERNGDRMGSMELTVDRSVDDVQLADVKIDVFGDKINANAEHRNEANWWKLAYGVSAELNMLVFDQSEHSFSLEKRDSKAQLQSKTVWDGQDVYELRADLTLDRKNPSVKASLTRADVDPITVDVALKKKRGKGAGYGLEGRAQWNRADGYATVSGEAKYTPVPLSFEISANLDNPTLNIEKWVVVASSKLDNGRRTLSFKADKAGEREVYVVDLSYIKETDAVKGNGRFIIRSHKYTGEFSLPTDWVNQDVPALVSVKAMDGAENPAFKTIEFKREKKEGYKEVIYGLSGTISKSSYKLQLAVLNNKPLTGVDGRLTLTFEARADKQVTSYETVAALSTQNNAIVAELLNTQGKGKKAKKLGVTVDLREGKFVGALYLFGRVIRAEDTWSQTEENGRTRMNVGCRFWLDFEKEPKQVLTLTVNVREEAALKGIHYTGDATLSHPVLSKELKITEEIILFGEKKPIFYKANWDIFGAGQQPIEWSVEHSYDHGKDDTWNCHSALIVSRPPDIDFRIVRDTKKEGRVLTGKFKISAGKTERDSKAFEANSLIDAGDSPKASFSLRAPGQFLELEGHEVKTARGRRAASRENCKWIWTLKQTESMPIIAEVEHSTDISLPSLSIQVYDSDKPTKRLRYRTGYVNPDKIELNFDSIDNGVETLYVRRTIELKNNHVLSHKLSWKQENFRGLWEGFKYRGKMVGEHLVDGIKAAHDLVEAWRASYKAAGSVEPAIGPLNQRVEDEISEFIDEIESDPNLLIVASFAGIDDVRESLEGLVDAVKNLNVLPTLVEKILDLLDHALGEQLGFTSDDVRNWVDRTGDELEKTAKDLKAALQKILDDVKNGKDDLSFQTVLDFVEDLLGKVKSVFDFVNDFLEELKQEYKINELLESLELLGETADELMEFVWKCRYFKPLKDLYDEARQWFRDAFKIDRDRFNNAWTDLKDKTNEIFEESGGKLVVWEPEKGEIEIDIPVPAIVTTLRLPLSPVQSFLEAVKESGLAKVTWDKVGPTLETFIEPARDLIREVQDEVSALLREAIDAVSFDKILKSLPDRLSFRRPGSLPLPPSWLLGLGNKRHQFEVYSSGDVADESSLKDSVSHVAELVRDAAKYLEKAAEFGGYGSIAQSSWLNNLLGGLGWLTPLHAIPPYKGSAYISGHDHLISFDRKVHNFAGKCRYLLARENVQGKYSLEADYSASRDSEHPKKSLIFNALKEDGTFSSIEITPEYAVKLNGQPANLPFRAENVWVTMEAPTLVQVHWDQEGVTLTCDTAADFCRFRVSAWVHGRVSGLLGSNDRERVNDMLSPSGQSVNSVVELASQWKTSRDCQDAPRAYSGPGLPACAKAFRDPLSPFGDCKKRVDPEPFYQACMNLPLSDKDGFCHLAGAYRMACFDKGKTLPQVDECSKCDFQGREVNEGTESDVKTTAANADVVLVVNQASRCLSGAMTVDGFAKELRAQATAQGISDLHLGIVGYGNEEIDDGHPTILTSDGHVWLEKDAPIPGLDFKGGDLMENMTHAFRGKNEGTLKALVMATSFQFRPEASKSIVLLSCTPCERSLDDLLSARFYRIEKELLLHGITLHALSPRDIQVKATSKNKKAQKQIIGIDSNAAYKVGSLSKGEFTPDVALRADVSVEPDHCAQLAQMSHGSVFSLPRLREVEDKAAKFRQVFTRRVVASLSGPQNAEVCQKCSCVVNPWGRPVMHCELCEPRSADLGYRTNDSA